MCQLGMPASGSSELSTEADESSVSTETDGDCASESVDSAGCTLLSLLRRPVDGEAVALLARGLPPPLDLVGALGVKASSRSSDDDTELVVHDMEEPSFLEPERFFLRFSESGSAPVLLSLELLLRERFSLRSSATTGGDAGSAILTTWREYDSDSDNEGEDDERYFDRIRSG